MAEVKHILNGKNFKDFGVYISESQSLFDILKVKNLTKNDWKEYHGHSVDLSVKKVEARVIVLKGFVLGDNWEEMRSNFYELFSELNKPGTQRYAIEPFGMTPLYYEVYREDAIDLKKNFTNGKMVGLFSLEMIEPNPMKKILKVDADAINLKITGDTSAEIFWGDGTKTDTTGNFYTNYIYGSNNYVESTEVSKTILENNNTFLIESTGIVAQNFLINCIIEVENNVFGKAYLLGKKDGIYDVISTESIALNSGSNLIKIPFNSILSEYERFVVKILDDDGNEIEGLQFVNVNIYNATITNKPAVTGEKIVIIAGNIEELTIETDAEVLWTEL